MGYDEYDETDIGVAETDTLYSDDQGNLYLYSEISAEVDQYSDVVYTG
jgi:hypothetical protein